MFVTAGYKHLPYSFILAWRITNQHCQDAMPQMAGAIKPYVTHMQTDNPNALSGNFYCSHFLFEVYNF